MNWTAAVAKENDAFKLLGRLDESKFTFPTVKASAQERDTRKAGGVGEAYQELISIPWGYRNIGC
jgi:hypothetical protein